MKQEMRGYVHCTFVYATHHPPPRTRGPVNETPWTKELHPRYNTAGMMDTGEHTRAHSKTLIGVDFPAVQIRDPDTLPWHTNTPSVSPMFGAVVSVTYLFMRPRPAVVVVAADCLLYIQHSQTLCSQLSISSEREQ